MDYWHLSGSEMNAQRHPTQLACYHARNFGDEETRTVVKKDEVVDLSVLLPAQPAVF